MGVKVNLVIDERVKADLDELIPAGERSRFASEALKARLALVRQQQAIARLEGLRRAGPHVPTSEVVSALRSLRNAE
jgi:predicted transcriptional regulator